MMVSYYMAKSTGILYKIERHTVYYFNNQAHEWRECFSKFKSEIENNPEYYIKVDNVTVA
ncbi:hypothetical protein AC84_1505 [Escherichia coli 1-392-07_S4_C1]|nr:hypothetical protein AC15_1534 [Escherichia coli 2-156-04_S3_C2]KEO02241.1 hypothetical protein AC84_1505 [Escherichia coli 1-392-07_S4_C1]MDN1876709.1 hypothetical protein [Escherichia coli]TNH65377.1 hypothetical protein FG869_06595 [Escherichia coli]TPD36247.1 hypothetical protein FIS44_15765 [Escherichia coli]